MKKKAIVLSIFLFFFTVSFSFAGSNSLIGDWEGSATAILPNGNFISEIGLEGSLNILYENLFSGNFTFTLPGSSPLTAFATGNIIGQKIQGIMSYQVGPSSYQGVAFFEAQLKGKKMVGIVRDISDGSTSSFSAYRVE